MASTKSTYVAPNDQPQNANFRDDAAISFFWKRHTILFGAVCFSMLFYVGVYTEPAEDSVANTKMGLAVASVMFLLTGVTQFNDGPFIRPHPAVWRLVLGISVLYWLFVVFLLFQTPHQARMLMKLLDPKLGVEPAALTYSNNCDVYVADHPSGILYDRIDLCCSLVTQQSLPF